MRGSVHVLAAWERATVTETVRLGSFWTCLYLISFFLTFSLVSLSSSESLQVLEHSTATQACFSGSLKAKEHTHIRFSPLRVKPETGVVFDIEYDWTESWGMRYGDGPHPVPPTAVFIYATWYRNLHTCTHMQHCLPLYFTPDSMFQMKNYISWVFVVLEENIFLRLCEDCTSISFC